MAYACALPSPHGDLEYINDRILDISDALCSHHAALMLDRQACTVMYTTMDNVKIQEVTDGSGFG